MAGFGATVSRRAGWRPAWGSRPSGSTSPGETDRSSGSTLQGTLDYYFPAWQFDREGQPLPVVRRVIEAARARGLDDERLFEILSTRAGLVGGKPLAQGVQDGDEEQLLAAVRSARP